MTSIEVYSDSEGFISMFDELAIGEDVLFIVRSGEAVVSRPLLLRTILELT